MLRFYFYCPKCEFEDVQEAPLPNGVASNCRGGYGTPIYHYECPKCHNLDAGYMQFSLGKMGELTDEEQKQYFKSMIEMYQNIRCVKG